MKRKLKQIAWLIFTIMCLLLVSTLSAQASTNKVFVGSEITLSFQSSSEKDVIWSVKNPNVLRIKSTKDNKASVSTPWGSSFEISHSATLVGLSIGTTSVTAQDETGNLLFSADVSVEKSDFDFRLNFDYVFLSVGESLQLEPIEVPSGESLVWTSDDPFVNVSSTGVVSLNLANRISEVVCHTSDGLYSATCTVIGDSPTYSPDLMLAVGDSGKLTYSVNVYGIYGDLPDLQGVYSSSNPSVATVDSNGIVNAKSAGITNVIAKLGNKTLTYVIRVLAPEPTATPTPTAAPTAKPTATPTPTVTPSPSHKHIANLRRTTTKATTTENGNIQVKCIVCGKIITNQTIYHPETISLSSATFTYNGQVQKPSVEVKDSNGKVINPANYTVTYSGKCKSAGTYNVTIDFKGNYSGTVTKAFTIAKASRTISASNQIKTLGAKTFTLNAKLAAGKGKLTYKSGNPNVATVSSTGKVTIKGVGKSTITITAAATANYKRATKKIVVKVKPKGTSISTVTNSSSQKATVTWKQNNAVTGYQIRYSTSSAMTGAKTITIRKNGTLKKTIPNLTEGKTYYVQIRTYKTVSGKRYYSEWSTAKKVTITK